LYSLESQESSVVAQLIRHGANPEQCDTELNTCWHIAVRLGKVNLCELLLHARHLINAPNQNGTTPVHLVCNENDDVEMFEWLVAHGANVDLPVPPNGESLASVAARLNRPGILHLIAHFGHPIDEVDGSRRTPLIHAVTQENSAAVAMLLHLGADVHKMTFSGSALELAEQQLAVQHTATRETIVDMLREHSVIV
jgi:ankyrin repeat protein